MPVLAAPNNFVPALAKEPIPVSANCSTTSQLIPSSVERQMKLSSATMIALSLTMALPAFVMMEGTTCQVFPLSVDRAIPLSLGSASKNAQTEESLIAKELTTLLVRPVVPLHVSPLSVDLKTFSKPGQPLETAANKLPPETIMSLIEVRSMPPFAATQFKPLSVDLYTPCNSVPA